MTEMKNMSTEDVVEALDMKVTDLLEENDLLAGIIQCLLKDAPNYERNVWDSELGDAFEDPRVTIEPVSCAGCAEGSLRIYLDDC